MGRFLAVGKLGFAGWRSDFGASTGGAFQFDAISVVPKPVDGG
jgi:hypothetical protein